MPKIKIKKGDQVQVIAGSYKGTKGEVVQVIPEINKVIVSGVNVVKKHVKPTAQNPQGGIVEKEAPIQVSNVSLVDAKSGKPTRVGFKIEGDKKVRVSKKSGQAI